MNRRRFAEVLEGSGRFGTLATLRTATLFCAALLLLTTCGSLFNSPGSPSPVGSVQGSVTDAVSGQPLATVVVTVRERATTTDGMGRFSLGGLPTGTFDLTARRAGYVPFTQSVTLTNAPLILELRLQPE